MNFYKKLIAGVEDRGWEWVLFSNGMASDQKFGRQLLKGLGYTDFRKLLNPPANSLDFLNLIRSFRCVFGARLHACITSYALDVPVVGLIWSEKLRIFAEVIGKKNAFFEEEDLHIENILDAIATEMESGYDTEIRENLRGLTRQYLQTFLQIIGD